MRRFFVLAVATAVVLAALVAVQQPAQAAGPGMSTIAGFDLPERAKPTKAVRDRFRVSGPRGRTVVVQHRAPGQRWQTVVKAKTTKKRMATVRIRVVPVRDSWVWSARLQRERWRVVARTASPVHAFRVKAPRTRTHARALSKAQRVRVESTLGSSVGKPAGPPRPSPGPDNPAPGAVTDLSVDRVTTGSLYLSWSNPSDADLAEVIVRRATGSAPPTSVTAGESVPLAEPKATSHLDSGLAPDTTYSYALFTRDTSGATGTSATTSATTAPAGVQTVCDSPALAGPPQPPAGAVVVETTDNLSSLTSNSPEGTTFWLAPGRHTLGTGEYDQVRPKDGNTYLGAPGAVLDGQGLNRYAFGQQARDVTIQYLTVRGFEAPNNEGVVNHDSGDNWTIRGNTIENNAGAGLMIGDGNVIEGNCLRDNGQYGFNAFEPDGVVDVSLRGNEITGNNTDDWEAQRPGCGCTGGGKFWNTTGATITGNYIHDNRSVGLWADGVNSDFVIDGNHISDNDAEGIFYEQSYNATITNNTLLRNALVKGPTNPGFPAAAIYISEAGADPRAPGGRSTMEISGNTFTDNWSGVLLWENADRFAGSSADTSGAMTIVNPAVALADCSDPDRIGVEPYYSDCRWKTQNIKVRGNSFDFDPATLGEGCTPTTGCGYNGVFSNFGTYPDWSPYRGTTIQAAITFEQNNTWTANTYRGPWRFTAYDPSNRLSWDAWRSPPYNQDTDSTSEGAVAE